MASKTPKNIFNGINGNVAFFRRHPVLSNILIIFIVGLIGILIAFVSLQLFTRHGASDIVPRVENMSYTDAIKILHNKGFRVDIRDSIFKDDIKPGYVIEQFPKANASVKPGRKVFLYINAVHPREMVIDVDNNPYEDALKGYSLRQGMARLEELGFKHVKIVKVSGDTDRIIRITANGRPIKKMEKTPVTADLVVEVYDGSLNSQADSILNEEYLQMLSEEMEGYEENVTTEETNSNSEEEYEDIEPAFVQ